MITAKRVKIGKKRRVCLEVGKMMSNDTHKCLHHAQCLLKLFEDELYRKRFELMQNAHSSMVISSGEKLSIMQNDHSICYEVEFIEFTDSSKSAPHVSHLTNALSL